LQLITLPLSGARWCRAALSIDDVVPSIRPSSTIMTMHTIYVSSPLRNCDHGTSDVSLFANQSSQSVSVLTINAAKSRRRRYETAIEAVVCFRIKSFSLLQPAIGFIICCHQPQPELCLRHAVRTVEPRSPAYAVRVSPRLLIARYPSPNVVTFLQWVCWLYNATRSNSSHLAVRLEPHLLSF
jgi:hypothetical protein